MENKRFQVGCPDPETGRMYWYVWDSQTGGSKEFAATTDHESERLARSFAENTNGTYKNS